MSPNNEIHITLQGEEDLDQKLKNLPSSPGVYQFKNEAGKVIYVGKAINLKSRVRSYFRENINASPKNQALVSKIKNLEIIVTDNEVEALLLESNLIKSLKPRYNVLLKDDKSYPCIRITNEPFPQVFPTRHVIKDGSKYYGPYTEVRVMRSALKVIRDVFQIKNCKFYLDSEIVKAKKVKLCLEYQIKKCGGPCEGLVSLEEYQEMIKNVKDLLDGKTEKIIESLTTKMNKFAEEMRYEDASIIKKKIELLEVYSSKQKVFSLDHLDKDYFALASEDNMACGLIFKIRNGKLIDKRQYYLSNTDDKNESEILEAVIEKFYFENEFIPDEIILQAELEDNDIIKKWLEGMKKGKVSISLPKDEESQKLLAMCKNNARFLLDELKIQKMKKDNYIPFSVKALQKDLNLTSLPIKIECFDISNIQGSDSVASLVVFEEGRPKRSEYRKFKIKTVEGPNDFESMREVVFRRYKRLLEENKKLPNLIMVDGGKGQLSSAIESLKKLEIKNIPIVGLAKRLEEIFFPNDKDPRSLPKTSSSLKLLQSIRDEAHRFAITFHRDLRSNRTLQTELEQIDSIGEVKSKNLLQKLGSVKAVKNADITQIAEIVGEASAKKIKEYFKTIPEE